MKTPDVQDICEENYFTGFFRKNIHSLRNYLFFKFGDEDLADDMAQEAFVKLWQNCSEVRHPKSFLYTVANNASLNQVALKKVVLNYRQNNAGNDRDYENPEYLVEVDEFRQKFDRAIAGLSEAQRTALLLNRIEGKKYKEIAEMLGISVKAVEKRIHGALIFMREQIENFR